MSNLTHEEECFLQVLKAVKCISTRMMSSKYIQIAEDMVYKKVIGKQSTATNSVYHPLNQDCSNYEIPDHIKDIF